MEKFLNSPIKEVITVFPEVGRILDEYHIGCTACGVGSCLLKDIIEIHQLPEEEGREMLARVAKGIYPDREIDLPEIGSKPAAKSKRIAYSPPMKKLVDEHEFIKRWIRLIPELVRNLDLDAPQDQKLALDGVYFIRNYADRFHHAKEEEILFKYFDENAGILKVMLEDHVAARGHARAIEEGVTKKDRGAVVEHILAYQDLLTEHIRKEDEILYPWMDRNLSTRQVGELFSKFGKADESMDKESTKRCIQFIQALEQRLGRAQKEAQS